MNNFQIPRLLLILGAMTAVLTGCSTDVPEPLIHTPSNGSIFNYDNYQTDSAGTKIDASETHTSRTILNTNATIEGKSGVVQFQEGSDTISMKYEANGDVQLLQPATSFPNADFPAPAGLDFPSIRVPARWVPFGLGSKAQQMVPGYDTTVFLTIPSIPLPIAVVIHAAGNTTYLGTENFIVAGETLSTQKALLTVNIQFSAAGIMNGSVTNVDTLLFAPKLGMFVKDIGQSSAELPAQFGTSGPQGGTVSVLTGYAVK